jgi:hypothetical protein
MLARPYREALHHARRDKARPEVMAARCEVERNAATFALNLIGRWDDMEAEAETLMGRMVRGDKFSEPPAVLSLLARAVRLDGIHREMAICIAARMLAAEAAARVLREDAMAAQKAGKSPTFSDDDDAVIAALREIKPGRLADPGRVEQRGAERWAERSRGGMTEALWEEPGGPTLEEQMAQSDDRLRTAGYHITEDVIRAAVAEYAAKENQR